MREGIGRLKAIVRHNKITNTIQFRVGKFSLIYAIPSKLKYIKEISNYEDGFITMQTNYGEEYTDLIELTSNGIFPDSFKKKMSDILSALKLSDIKLERG